MIIIIDPNHLAMYTMCMVMFSKMREMCIIILEASIFSDPSQYFTMMVTMLESL